MEVKAQVSERRITFFNPRIVYIKLNINAKTIYLDLEEEDFNIGFVINDILLEARFAPSEQFMEDRGTN